jgi:hypothetical protein
MTEGVGATLGARGTSGALTAGQIGAGASGFVVGAGTFVAATVDLVIGNGCKGFTVGGTDADAGTEPVGGAFNGAEVPEVPDELPVPF